MKLLDRIIEKIAKVPLMSRASSRFTSFFRAVTRLSGNYYQSWVFLAVTSISQEVAGIKFKLFKEDSKGNVEQIFRHPALAVLKKANDFMTQYDLFERLQANLELRGNEYWFVTLIGGQPSAIYPLNPESVSPVGGTDEYILGYKYALDGKVIPIPKENIIHFKNFNPDSDILGLSTLSAAKTAADTDNYAREYNKKYFQNDARPDVILEFPDVMKPEDEKRLIESWNQNHAGPQRQFRTAVASGGLQIKGFQISQRDMEYLEGRKFNRDEIMAMFRVPLAIAGFTGNETYASAKAATYAFGSRTIKPKMTKITNTLNEFYLPRFKDTDGFEFEFDSPVLEDRELILKEYDMGIKGGWLSINDVRRMEDLPEVENGEDVFVPFNVMPLGAPKKGKAVNENPSFKIVAKTIISKAFKSLTPTKELTDEEKRFEKEGEVKIKTRDNTGLEFEARFKKVLNELWEGQQKRAIAKLKESLKSKNWKATAPNVLDNKKEAEVTVDLLTPLMTDLTEKEAISALEFLGIFGDEVVILTPELQKFIKGNTKKLAGEMTDETTKKLRATISAGLENGEAIADIEKRILDSTAFSVARAEVVARTETIRAQTKAELEVWKESGVVTGKVWFTAEDERTCPNCGPMHGKKIGVGKDFFKRGEQAPDGLPLDYENVAGPPLHPNCRCTLIPETS